MKAPAGPPLPPRAPRPDDDSSDATAPGLHRAPPPNARALAMLDDEPTTVARPEAPDPATLPLGARVHADYTHDGPTSQLAGAPRSEAAVVAALDASVEALPRDPMPIHRLHDASLPSMPAPAPRPATLAPASRPGLFAPVAPAPPAPAPIALAPPPPAVLAPPTSRAPEPDSASDPLFAAPADDLFGPPPPAAPSPSAPPAPLVLRAPAAPLRDDEDVDRSHFAEGEYPCSLRALLERRKSDPARIDVERAAIALARCVEATHARGVVFGEHLVPENFQCQPDGTVTFAESRESPPRPIVEQYLAPELFRGKAVTVASDVFATAAVVYELLVGRALKPAFLPTVMQSSRTDTWFSDPGASMRDPYRFLLRRALADRASQRHADMATFAEELFRAWRVVHNPVARPAEKPEAPPLLTKAAKVGIAVAVFVVALLALALFPVERIDAPAVPTVRPSLAQ